MAAYDSLIVIMSAAFSFIAVMFIAVYMVQHISSRLRKRRH